MERNTLLKISLVLGRIAQIMLIVVAVGLIIIFGIWLFKEEVLSNFYFVVTGHGFQITNNPGDSSAIALSDTGTSVIIFNLIKGLMVLCILYFIIHQGISVIKSIRRLSTFRSDNVLAFRRMGGLFLLWFLIDIISVSQDAMNIKIEPNHLIGSLICFILAEIFREGNRLMEENNLTI